jgi:WD40 repeat protein
MKVYHDLHVSARGINLSHGVCFQPALEMVSNCVDRLTKLQHPGPRDPLAWWDNLRYKVHGNVTFNLSKFGLSSLGSLDPFDTQAVKINVNQLRGISQSGKLVLKTRHFSVSVEENEKLDKNRSKPEPSSNAINPHDLQFAFTAPSFCLRLEYRWVNSEAFRCECTANHEKLPLTHYPHFYLNEVFNCKKPSCRNNQDVFRFFRATGIKLTAKMIFSPVMEPGGHASNSDSPNALHLAASIASVAWLEKWSEVVTGDALRKEEKKYLHLQRLPIRSWPSGVKESPIKNLLAPTLGLLAEEVRISLAIIQSSFELRYEELRDKKSEDPRQKFVREELKNKELKNKIRHLCVLSVSSKFIGIDSLMSSVIVNTANPTQLGKIVSESVRVFNTSLDVVDTQGKIKAENEDLGKVFTKGKVNRVSQREVFDHMKYNLFSLPLLAYRSQLGRQVVCGSADGKVRIWNAVTGKIVKELEGHTDSITCVCFSPDGERAVSGSKDCSVRLWDSLTGKQLWREDHPGAITSLYFSSDSRRVISASSDHSIRIWDLGTDPISVKVVEQLNRIRIPTEPNNPRKSHLVDSINLGEPFGEISAMCYCPSSIWKNSDSGLKLLDVIVVCGLGNPVDGNQEKLLWVLDLKSREVVRRVFVGPEVLTDEITCLCFSQDGCRIVSGAKDMKIRIWDVNEGRDHIATPDDMTIPKHSNIFSHPSNTSNPTLLERVRSVSAYRARVGSERKEAKETLRNSPRKHPPLVDFPMLSLPGHSGEISSVCFSHDGRQVASGSTDHSVIIWDAMKGEQLHRLKGHTGKVTSVCFSQDGRLVLSGSSDQSIRIWDAMNGKEVCKLIGGSEEITCVCFFPENDTSHEKPPFEMNYLLPPAKGFVNDWIEVFPDINVPDVLARKNMINRMDGDGPIFETEIFQESTFVLENDNCVTRGNSTLGSLCPKKKGFCCERWLAKGSRINWTKYVRKAIWEMHAKWGKRKQTNIDELDNLVSEDVSEDDSDGYPDVFINPLLNPSSPTTTKPTTPRNRSAPRRGDLLFGWTSWCSFIETAISNVDLFLLYFVFIINVVAFVLLCFSGRQR